SSLTPTNALCLESCNKVPDPTLLFSYVFITEDKLYASVAVYQTRLHPCNHSDVWLFIQHGSYQWIRLAAQPHLEDGRRPDPALSGNSGRRDVPLPGLCPRSPRRTRSANVGSLPRPTVANVGGFRAVVQHDP